MLTEDSEVRALFREMARVSGQDYPEEPEDNGADNDDDDVDGECMEEGEEEEEHEHDECIADEGKEEDEVIDLSPKPRTPSPAELHDAIRPSPTAAPSGSNGIRSCIAAKLQQIKELESELGLTCFDRIDYHSNFKMLKTAEAPRPEFDRPIPRPGSAPTKGSSSPSASAAVCGTCTGCLLFWA